MVEQLQHFKTFMFHTVVERGYFRGGEMYYIYFVANILLLPTVKEFYSTSALLAMQSAVITRGILSVCPSVRPSVRHVPDE